MAINNPYFIRPTINSGFMQLPNISLGNVWTFESLFLYPLSPTPDWNTFIRGSVSDHQIIVQKTNLHLGMYDSVGGSGFNDTGFVMSTLSNGWHHMACVGENNTQKYYIDGVLVGQVNRQSKSDIRSVGAYWGNSQTWGDFDEVRLWNIARTQTQIKTYVNRWLIGNETGLVGYWKCNEGIGVTIKDETSNKRNGILQGSNTWVIGTLNLINSELHDIDIVSSNAWYENTYNIKFNLNLEAKYGVAIQYKILIDDIQFYPDSGFSSLLNLPNNISFTIPISKLKIGDNLVVFEIKNETSVTYRFGEYNIIKENKDTIKMQRKFLYSNEWSVEDNIKIDSNGLTLKKYGNNVVVTTDYTRINTIGKRRLLNVFIDGSSDIKKESTYTDKMINRHEVANGYQSEYKLQLERWTTVKSIEVQSI